MEIDFEQYKDVETKSIDEAFIRSIFDFDEERQEKTEIGNVEHNLDDFFSDNFTGTVKEFIDDFESKVYDNFDSKKRILSSLDYNGISISFVDVRDETDREVYGRLRSQFIKLLKDYKKFKELQSVFEKDRQK